MKTKLITNTEFKKIFFYARLPLARNLYIRKFTK